MVTNAQTPWISGFYTEVRSLLKSAVLWRVTWVSSQDRITFFASYVFLPRSLSGFYAPPLSWSRSQHLGPVPFGVSGVRPRVPALQPAATLGHNTDSIPHLSALQGAWVKSPLTAAPRSEGPLEGLLLKWREGGTFRRPIFPDLFWWRIIWKDVERVKAKSFFPSRNTNLPVCWCFRRHSQRT